MKSLVTTLIVFLWVITPVCSQELTGKQIVDRVNELINQETVKAEMKLTILTTSGQKRTFEYESYSKNKGEKNLIRYLLPRRVKGNAILMLNNADDIWMYFSRTKRVRKLATHAKKQKMEGSDFSYEDMGAGNSFVKDFTAKRLRDEKMKDDEGKKYDCYKVELTRKKESKSTYSRMIIWVVKKNFVPIVIDYYDEKKPNRLLKRLAGSNINITDNVPTLMKMTMYNKLDNTQTSMEFTTVQYNVKLDDSMFTERGLRK